MVNATEKLIRKANPARQNPHSRHPTIQTKPELKAETFHSPANMTRVFKDLSEIESFG